MAWLVLSGILLCMLGAGLGTSDLEDVSPPAPHNCPDICICAADVLSCAGRGLQDLPVASPTTAAELDLSHNALKRSHPGWLAPLSRSRALHLGYNKSEVSGHGAFTNASGSRTLDSSSNMLRMLHTHDSDGSEESEKLLSFNNSSMHLDSDAFQGSRMLSHLYLSCNELSSFSFNHLHGSGLTRSRTSDLSSNWSKHISIPELAASPTYLKNRLYSHNNPSPCDCSLYHSLRRWHQRGSSASHDFEREYTCLVFKVSESRVRFFEHSRVFKNCSVAAAPGLESPEEQSHAQVGQSSRLFCNTSVPATRVAWVSPKNESLVAPASQDGSIAVLADGSLAIGRVQEQHAGVFVCSASGPRSHHNQTLEYNVSVQKARPEPETFNTGFTTSSGCIVGSVSVLLYLFAPPCRGCCHCCQRACRNRCWPRASSPLQESSAQSSMLSTTPPDAPSRKASVHKHVVFSEPGKKGLNGRVQLAVAEDFDSCNPMGLQLKAGSESASSTGSEGLVMS